MKSLFNIIEIYFENPLDKDMERVLGRESTKNNIVKMYDKIKDLERQLEETRKAYEFNLDLLSEKERQLEEAREKIDIQNGHLELAISLSDDLNIKLLCTALLEQLKEQG